jgi:meckelin
MWLLQVSLYWLVLYKLQEGVLLLMLPDDQLYNFWVTVVLAMVGQSVGLLQMLYQQIRYRTCGGVCGRGGVPFTRH